MTKTKETTRNNFSLAVERKAVEEELTYLDALTAVVEECDIEPVAAAKLINSSLRQKLQHEATKLRLLKDEESPTLEAFQ